MTSQIRQSVAELVEISSAFGEVGSVIHTAGVSPSMGAADLIIRIKPRSARSTSNENFYRIAGEGFAFVNVASMAAQMVPRIAVPTRQFKYAVQNEHAFMKR